MYTDLLFPALVALIPLLITPGLLFHYDSLPKVALLALAMASLMLRPGEVAGELAALWRERSGKLLCAVAAVQVLWSGIATAASTRPWFSLFGSNWRRFGFLTILALAVFAVTLAAHLLRRPDRVNRVLRAMTIAAIGVSCYGIAQYFGIDPWQAAAAYQAQDGDLTIVRPPSTLGHADYLGWWLSAAVFCSWGVARAEAGTWRRIALAASGLSLVAIVLSGTRSALVAVGVALACLVLGSRFRLRARYAAAVLGIAAAAMVFYISPAGERLRARVQWSKDEVPGGGRPLLWRDSLRMAAAHPLAGFGPETFAAEFPHYQSLELARLVPDFYHESPHNVALDALTGEGIPGLLIALGWLAAGGVAAWKTRREVDPLAAAFVACCTAAAFNALTIGPAVATLVVIALLVARDAGSDSAPRTFSPGVTLAAGLPVAVALTAFALALLLSDFRLEQFRQTAAANTVARYAAFRQWHLPGASEDLYCSRQIAGTCGKASGPVARLECSHNAMLAAAQATGTADNPPNAWYNLAMFGAAQNDGRTVESALRGAIAMAPNWFRPHWALANFLLLNGRKGEAVAEIDRATLLSAGKRPEVTASRQKIAAAK